MLPPHDASGDAMMADETEAESKSARTSLIEVTLFAMQCVGGLSRNASSHR